MKNIVIGVASAIVLVLLLFCIYTLQGDATRKTESSDSITQAMENAAAKMTEDEEVYTASKYHLICQTYLYLISLLSFCVISDITLSPLQMATDHPVQSC